MKKIFNRIKCLFLGHTCIQKPTQGVFRLEFKAGTININWCVRCCSVVGELEESDTRFAVYGIDIPPPAESPSPFDATLAVDGVPQEIKVIYDPALAMDEVIVITKRGNEVFWTFEYGGKDEAVLVSETIEKVLAKTTDPRAIKVSRQIFDSLRGTFDPF